MISNYDTARDMLHGANVSPDAYAITSALLAVVDALTGAPAAEDGRCGEPHPSATAGSLLRLGCARDLDHDGLHGTDPFDSHGRRVPVMQWATVTTGASA